MPQGEYEGILGCALMDEFSSAPSGSSRKEKKRKSSPRGSYLGVDVAKVSSNLMFN